MFTEIGSLQGPTTLYGRLLITRKSFIWGWLISEICNLSIIEYTKIFFFFSKLKPAYYNKTLNAASINHVYTA
jgi:hypothetical protein